MTASLWETQDGTQLTGQMATTRSLARRSLLNPAWSFTLSWLLALFGSLPFAAVSLWVSPWQSIKKLESNEITCPRNCEGKHISRQPGSEGLWNACSRDLLFRWWSQYSGPYNLKLSHRLVLQLHFPLSSNPCGTKMHCFGRFLKLYYRYFKDVLWNGHGSTHL